MNKQFTLAAAVVLLGVAACQEADQVADHVTGKTPIEKKVQMEDALNKAQDTHNKAIEDAGKATE